MPVSSRESVTPAVGVHRLAKRKRRPSRARVGVVVAMLCIGVLIVVVLAVFLQG